MRYYYLHPFRIQYFFPKGFREHELFTSFFKPFTTRGAVTWWLFNHVWPYRILFGRNSIEEYIPEQAIRKLAGENAMMAFNTGTPGPGQKITGLGVLNNKEFFFKYAENEHAKKLVKNEGKILKQLERYNFLPAVRDYKESPSGVFLKTTVLNGDRLAYESMDERFIKRLFELSEMKVEAPLHGNYDDSLKTSFAHGDFCPWNMMESQNGILIYDWEMAGTYPLGYDLFTFIFQTNFLNKPENEIDTIISENENYIQQYFHSQSVNDWKTYLKVFAELKISDENKKESSRILDRFKELLRLAD